MEINQNCNELHLYPISSNEYMGAIYVNDRRMCNTYSTTIILDTSGSMKTAVLRFVTQILPTVMRQLNCPTNYCINLITFASETHLSHLTQRNLKNSSIRNKGKTLFGPAIDKLLRVLENHARTTPDVPMRILTISDGEIDDAYDARINANELMNFVANSNLMINSQAMRLFTTDKEPDTKALSYMLQINNTTTTELCDVRVASSDHTISDEIVKLFRMDCFENYQTLQFDRAIILKFPWNHQLLMRVILSRGWNIFWLKCLPTGVVKLGCDYVKVIVENELTLGMFHELMETKMAYITNHMIVLKLVGTSEANRTVNTIFEYFEETENALASKYSTPNNNVISNLLDGIAKNQTNFNNSAQMAEFLRQSNEKIKIQRDRIKKENEARVLALEKQKEAEEAARKEAADEARIKEQKAAEETGIKEQKAAEEARIKEQKAAEEAGIKEQKAAEDARIQEQKKSEEAARKKREAEAESARIKEQKEAEEAARKKVADEARIKEQKAAEEAHIKEKAAEEARIKERIDAEEAARKEKEAREAEERRVKQEKEARDAEELRVKQEEEARQAEEACAKQEEEERAAEEARIEQEKEAREAEELRVEQEEEARQAEETRVKRAEEERADEETRIKQEKDARETEELRVKLEEEARQAEETRVKREEEDRIKREEELVRQAEEKRLKQELVISGHKSNPGYETNFQTVFILDEENQRFTKRIIPLMLTKLFCESSKLVHLVELVRHKTTVEQLCQSLLQTLDARKQIRVVVLTNNEEIQEHHDIKNFAETLIGYLTSSNYSVELQVVRLVSAKTTTRRYSLIDIDVNDSNDFIACDKPANDLHIQDYVGQAGVGSYCLFYFIIFALILIFLILRYVYLIFYHDYCKINPGN